LPPAKGRAVGKDFLCRLLSKAVGKGLFADCPAILAGGKERQSAKTSFADCLAGGKERQSAKGPAWQVAKKSWWQRWRPTDSVPFATCQAVRQSAKTKIFIFEI